MASKKGSYTKVSASKSKKKKTPSKTQIIKKQSSFSKMLKVPKGSTIEKQLKDMLGFINSNSKDIQLALTQYNVVFPQDIHKIEQHLDWIKEIVKSLENISLNK